MPHYKLLWLLYVLLVIAPPDKDITSELSIP